VWSQVEAAFGCVCLATRHYGGYENDGSDVRNEAAGVHGDFAGPAIEARGTKRKEHCKADDLPVAITHVRSKTADRW
jgi:hypothetical protein